MTLEEFAKYVWSKCDKKHRRGVICGYSFDNKRPEEAEKWMGVLPV